MAMLNNQMVIQTSIELGLFPRFSRQPGRNANQVLQYVLYLSDGTSGGSIIDLGNFSTLGAWDETPRGWYTWIQDPTAVY